MSLIPRVKLSTIYFFFLVARINVYIFAFDRHLSIAMHIAFKVHIVSSCQVQNNTQCNTQIF